jgi:hypothetical protein
MDDWVVSDRVEESCYVGSLLEGDRPEGFLPLKPQAVLVGHA